MTGVLTFDVDGTPAPQGSKTRTRWGGLREDNPRTKPWRAEVASQVRQQLPAGHVAIDGPVLLVATFTLPKPLSAPKRRRTWPDRTSRLAGDQDKLTRAVCDALTTAQVWRDDARVVRSIVGKDYSGAPGFRDTPGAHLRVVPLTPAVADAITAWADDAVHLALTEVPA